MTSTRKEQAAETAAALKGAAKRLFARRGYLNTKVTDITAEAGRAAGSFYNHFNSKEELLESLLADLAAEGDSSSTDPGHNPDFADPAGVRWHIEQYWGFYRRHAAVLQALRQAAMVNEDFGRTLARWSAAQASDVTGHLDHITRRGLHLPARPDVSVAMLYGVVDQAAQQWLLGPYREGWPEISDEEAIDALTRFVYRGLTGRDI